MDIQSLYDNFFGLKKESDVFEVEITKSSKDTFWYASSIGEKFHVMDEGGEDLKVMTGIGRGRFREEGAYIQKTDAIILT
jgi:diphthamide synthase subunit DPH2